MEKFWKELEIGEIHFRDRWQFELKSEFIPSTSSIKNSYTQEFYFFIPDALRVNKETYSKKQFFQDLTNLIRYKTPEFTLDEIIDLKNLASPISILWQLRNTEYTDENTIKIEYELKLLGNIIRSSVRNTIHDIFEPFVNPRERSTFTYPILNDLICKMIDQITRFCDTYNQVAREYESRRKSSIQRQFIHVEEFIKNSFHFYLVGLLEKIRKLNDPSLKDADHRICQFLVDKCLKVQKEDKIKSNTSEYFLYRVGLLNKFIHDPLLLKVHTYTWHIRYRHFIGSLSAGIAMLVFWLLFAWQGKVLIINSVPFILLTVVIYILKDRIKEGLRNVTLLQWLRVASDRTTEIRTPSELQRFGKKSEFVKFIDDAPKEISKIRNREFHTVLETFQRPETIIYYKSELSIVIPQREESRCKAINNIFRLDIHHFIAKAAEPSQNFVSYDPAKDKLIYTSLPKVYHINIILKNTLSSGKKNKKQIELKKYRLIVDKNGIKRVEHLY